MFDRRQFLVGLFGTAAVIAAGPIPKALAALTEPVFKDLFKNLPPAGEVYGNGKDYAFAKLEYLQSPPWYRVTIPEGYHPLREESDRIGAAAIARMKSNG